MNAESWAQANTFAYKDWTKLAEVYFFTLTPPDSGAKLELAISRENYELVPLNPCCAAFVTPGGQCLCGNEAVLHHWHGKRDRVPSWQQAPEASLTEYLVSWIDVALDLNPLESFFYAEELARRIETFIKPPHAYSHELWWTGCGKDLAIERVRAMNENRPAPAV